MSKCCELNIRDIGGGNVPKGFFIRSGKLSILTSDECTELCNRYNIKCVIDQRTPVESAEFPDPLPEGVEYQWVDALSIQRKVYLTGMQNLLEVLKVPSDYRGLRLVYKYDDYFHDDFNVSKELKIEYYDSLG